MVGQPLNPQWCFRPWNAEQKSVRSRKDALEHGQILNILSTLRKCIPEDRVLTCFHATRLLTEMLEGPVLPSSKQGQDSVMKARSQLFVWARNLSQVNPRNVCYLNSSVIAMASAGVVGAKPAAYGTLAASFSAVLAAGGVYVLHLRSWMKDSSIAATAGCR